MVELYGRCRSIASWINESEMAAFEADHPLQHVSLTTVAGILYVGQKGRFRNKLRCHQRKVVTKCIPKLSCNPAGAKYAKYCRYALIKYCPWEGSISNACGKNPIDEWHEFLEALASNSTWPPDFFDGELNAYRAFQKKNKKSANADDTAGMLINPGADGAGDILEEGGQDEWMHGADDNFAAIDNDEEDASGMLEWNRNHNWDIPADVYEGNHAPVTNMESTYDASMMKSNSTFKRKLVQRS
jgi:hypothetical protein